MKRVVDYNVKARLKSDNTGVDIANVKISVNPFDGIAAKEVVRPKEMGVVTEVIALSCGVAQCQDTLRTAMAIGADRAILAETNDKLQPLYVAKLLAAVVAKEQPGLVILGKQAIDDDANQTGQMLAALCDMPQANFASKVEVADGKARVTREVDGGLETVAITLPAVVTTGPAPERDALRHAAQQFGSPFERLHAAMNLPVSAHRSRTATAASQPHADACALRPAY